MDKLFNQKNKQNWFKDIKEPWHQGIKDLRAQNPKKGNKQRGEHNI